MLSKRQVISDSNRVVLVYPQGFALRSALGLGSCSHFWTHLILASTTSISASISLIVSFLSNKGILCLEGILEVRFRNEEIEARKAILRSYYMKGVILGALEKINQTRKHFCSFRSHLNVTSQQGFPRTQYLELPFFTIIPFLCTFIDRIVIMLTLPFSHQIVNSKSVLFIVGSQGLAQCLASSRPSIHVY